MIKDIKKVIELIKQRLSIAYKTRNHYLKDNIKSEKWESIIIILEGLYKEITGEEFAISEDKVIMTGCPDEMEDLYSELSEVRDD